MNRLVLAICVLLGILCSNVKADERIKSMQQRAALVNSMLDDKLTTVLPQLMRKQGIDMWVLISREYNEDPVLKTMLPSTWLSARRRTILVLFDPGEGKPLQRFAVARYAVDSLFSKAWDKEMQPDQWQRLVELIKQKAPTKIGINKSEHFALADGMTATEYEAFTAALPADYAKRLVSAEYLAINWLETRTALEMAHYPTLIAIGHDVIAEAFSNAVITPGTTTTNDVVWWLRDKSKSLGLENWFHPSVSIQRASAEKFDHLVAFSDRPETQIIQPGDLVHMDFGLTYLRLNSDQQQHAYVLREGETDAPAYLRQALANANRLQDIFTANFKVGRSGNEVLSMSRQQAIEEGIKPSIYTHPLGYHGHAAGTTLGMWDSQGGVPVQGDYPLQPNTAYSIELNAATFVPEWGKEIRIMLEENAFFDGDRVNYMDGRQTEFHLISSRPHAE
ncbi:M24 family metallopeptidase [Alteromonas oceanisediminis]|uniref:M24 family metallopeptidase n=1 Tax=Alteromonas oceanisediminis TaxID=2836180 RepID=UPI001BDA855C|nr:M24 family metallopeptidase [Alteromonas oceanisediminis]MBT0586539.1 M24 family metallopeptidase [Alteromonas oceanisediminis]